MVEQNLEQFPVQALSSGTVNAISLLLNAPKIIPTDTEPPLPRDWRGLAHLIGVPGEQMPSLVVDKDPCRTLLQDWSKGGHCNVAQLIKFLEQLDRFDVIEDTTKLIYQDYIQYEENKNRLPPSPMPDSTIDNLILTTDDNRRLNQGCAVQKYDAFILYAEEDIEFATELIEKLENFYGLKLCVKERDLVGGLLFEHEAIIRLISERCNRLVVILSTSFLKSSVNKFFVNFAQALGIEQKKRMIIPCVYEKCDIPKELCYYVCLNYYQSSRIWNFWDKLTDSIKTPNSNRNGTTVCRPPEFKANLLHAPRLAPKARSWSDLTKQELPAGKQLMQKRTSCDNAQHRGSVTQPLSLPPSTNGRRKDKSAYKRFKHYLSKLWKKNLVAN